MQVTLTGEPIQEQKPRYKREEWLREQYVEQGKSTYEIADMADCGADTVLRHLNKHGIETRTRKGGPPASDKVKNKNWICEQYVEQRKTTYEIADMADCSKSTVRRSLIKHGIARRKAGHQTSDKVKNKNWLREQYVEQGKSTYEIADMADCGADTVLRHLNKHGIETRTRKGGPPAPSKVKNKNWLREQYVERRKSTLEIADMIDCTDSTVRRSLIENGIETRPPPTDLSGADHPSYAGGESEYGLGWNESKKRAVRERDNNACRNCGMSQEQHRQLCNQRLHVHHITKAREFDDADKRNDMSNLIALCRECHLGHFERMADTGLQPQIPGVNYPDG
jgi:DNA-binding CsgD family transcriptional regulator